MTRAAADPGAGADPAPEGLGEGPAETLGPGVPASAARRLRAEARALEGGGLATGAAESSAEGPADGPAAGGPGPVLLIACGALAREVLALIRLNGWSHMTLRCLPADLHLRPERIPDAVEAAVREAREAGPAWSAIHVLYADCGAGGRLQARCAALGVEMLPGPHCYAFFDGTERFAARGDAEMTAFYLTDFLVRQFDAFVWRPMGLDRAPELRDMLFGNYDRLIHLAQTEDADLDARAREAAARLGLRHERRFTGYGDLAPALARAAAG